MPMYKRGPSHSGLAVEFLQGPLSSQGWGSEGTFLHPLTLFCPTHHTFQVEVRKVQANVENQMLIIASDSQKHHGRVSFLSVRWATTTPGPDCPSIFFHRALGTSPKLQGNVVRGNSEQRRDTWRGFVPGELGVGVGFRDASLHTHSRN